MEYLWSQSDITNTVEGKSRRRNGWWHEWQGTMARKWGEVKSPSEFHEALIENVPN